MVRFQLARDGVLRTIDALSDQARREIARTRREAQAAAERAFRRTQQNAAEATARLQKEAAHVQAQLAQATQPAVRRQQSGGSPRPTAQSVLSRIEANLDGNPTAKALAGHLVQQGAIPIGLLRGGAKAIEGLADAALFVARVQNPVLDRLLSPAGETAGEQFGSAVERGLEYVVEGARNPRVLIEDARSFGHQMRLDLDPSATPVAPTFKGELQRRLDIGMNQGELAFDVGSLAFGGPLAKSTKVFGAVRASPVEKYLAQGFTKAQAAHLAKPYPKQNMGHHAVARRWGLPKIFSESEFNILRPIGITRGDFYERHFQVDPHFHGTKLLNSGWSGKKLGLKRHGALGRIWYGTPEPLKARVGGLSAAAGSTIESGQGEEDVR
ncbi:hypothetical protein [Phenylobacterium sp.]|uniref:hypothetical protein n=1 Tax=Phenylobacterium sp. TaxID=1871053 RepID=UPI0027314B39|nr:hypothetical protein [Phenylobacterium sp.]MDP1618102.1 hypothetical protein [Phenylobacterium sp.]MDP1988697.1 hypothetical protein [Phenylobacterium sp.]